MSGRVEASRSDTTRDRLKDTAGRGELSRPKLSKPENNSKDLEQLRKQSETPVSLSGDDEAEDGAHPLDPEATELDSFHRHYPYDPSPARAALLASRQNSDAQQQHGCSDVSPLGPPPQSSQHLSKSRESRLTSAASHWAAGRPPVSHTHPAIHTDNRLPGSSTPPHESSEEEVADTEPHYRPQHPAVTNLETASVQDSLPSPSLSPITAAAQAGRSLSSSRLRGSDKFGSDASYFTSGSRKEDDSGASASSHISQSTKRSTERSYEYPTITDLPHLIDAFDAMPENLKAYTLHQLLRRCSKKTLHFVADAVSPALKVDYLKRLPLELSQNIVASLDAQSMCRAAQVSKKWRSIIDQDEKAWMKLLKADNFVFSQAELDRAVKEGWGWQIARPRNDAWEVNLGKTRRSKHASGEEREPRRVHAPVLQASVAESSSMKRKRTEDSSFSCASQSQKKQKRRERRLAEAITLEKLTQGHGPNAFAKLAEQLIPNPNIGLSSLQQLALHKSIYCRHHRLRKNWLKPDAKPRHIAFRAHEGHVITCLQFDKDKIITGSDDARIEIYDTPTGAQYRRLTGHEGGVWALEYQDNILVSGSTDRSVRIWDMNTGECLHVFQGHTSTVRCLQIVQPVQVGTKPDGRPIMMPPHRIIITGSRDSTCRVWRLPTMSDHSVYQAGPAATEENPFFLRVLAGHSHSVRAIAAHADTLVSGSYDNTVRVWQISTGETVYQLRGHTTKVYSVVLDYERKRCISGSMDTIVKIWSIETGELLWDLKGHSSLVGLLDLKDNVLVSAAADWTLKVWTPDQGRIRHTLKAHDSAITCFAHDGYKIVSGSEKTLKMWNTQTGECVRDLLTGLSGIWQVKFDERRCIAGVHRDGWTYIEVNLLCR